MPHQCIIKSVMVPTNKQAQDKSRVIKFVGTAQAVDRMGDVVEASGWELENYTKNPVFLWDHNPSLLPIGKTLVIERHGDQLTFDVEFATADLNPFADTVYRQYKNGFLSAVSVGFIPKEYDFIRDEHGMITGLRIKKQELLELSAVGIPAHPDALAVGEGKAFQAQVKAVTAKAEKPTPGMTLEEFAVKAIQSAKGEIDMEELRRLQEAFAAQQAENADLKQQVADIAKQVGDLVELKQLVELASKSIDALIKSLAILVQQKPVEVKSSPALPSTFDVTRLTGALETALSKLGSNSFTPKK